MRLRVRIFMRGGLPSPKGRGVLSANGAMSEQPGASPQDFDWILGERRRRDLTRRNELRFQRWHLVVARIPGALPQAGIDTAPLALTTNIGRGDGLCNDCAAALAQFPSPSGRRLG